jgi:hypothetical protein
VKRRLRTSQSRAFCPSPRAGGFQKTDRRPTNSLATAYTDLLSNDWLDKLLSTNRSVLSL